MIVTDLAGRAREQVGQSWMLGNFTFSFPGPGKLPVDCECSHLKTSISTFFPFSFSFPFPGYCGPALKLQPLFLRLQWKTCLRHNCSLGSCACSEGPALGENTVITMMMIPSIIKWPDVPFWPGQYRFSTCSPGVPEDFVGTPLCPVLLKIWNLFSIYN